MSSRRDKQNFQVHVATTRSNLSQNLECKHWLSQQDVKLFLMRYKALVKSKIFPGQEHMVKYKQKLIKPN